ncbi:MAG: hypothetical protein C3F13_09040 [Anaerolineales bacterium]|nr:hypothetical protein [Anaerolineae bacterium]PWB53546.1 MAG: hypothetical protein C3F13_09040 [Anaerolineales bacterium]
MQPQKKSLPFILTIIIVTVMVVFGGAVLVSAGVLATITPIREVGTPASSPEESSSSDVPTPTPSVLPNVLVNQFHVEVGFGSPIPVDVVVEGEWSTPCAQLDQVNLHYPAQFQLSIDLLSNPISTGCPASTQGLPFIFRFPLNMSGLPAGNYAISVNGVQASFDWPPVGGEQTPSETPVRIALVGPDGNVWIMDEPDGGLHQVTTDGTDLYTFTSPDITYDQPRLSSDGRFVAYQRNDSVQVGSGIQVDFGLWVTDLSTGASREVYDMDPASYSWKHGSHLLAFASELSQDYFGLHAGTPDSNFANRIQGYDAESQQTSDLVLPERGYAMVQPVWSPDGRFLSFNEVQYYEGQGPLAYVDFTNNQYTALDIPLGIYSWSPDSEWLAYDNLTYTATGNERIYIRTRESGEGTPFSQEYDPGYAAMPVFSPQDNQIAYLANLTNPDVQHYSLIIQPYPQGDPVTLGEFDNVIQLNWSPDGTRLILSSGPYEAQRISEVDVLTGETKIIAQGMQPSVAFIP